MKEFIQNYINNLTTILNSIDKNEVIKIKDALESAILN